MIKEVGCKVCKDKHFDHYECNICGLDFGFLMPKINYCPSCGNSLHRFRKHILTNKKICIIVNNK